MSIVAVSLKEETTSGCRARCSGVGAGMYAAKRTARIAVTSERAFETLERGWSRRSPGSIDDRRALAFGCRASRLPLCVGGNLPPSSSSSETTEVEEEPWPLMDGMSRSSPAIRPAPARSSPAPTFQELSLATGGRVGASAVAAAASATSPRSNCTDEACRTSRVASEAPELPLRRRMEEPRTRPTRGEPTATVCARAGGAARPREEVRSGSSAEPR
mmetsp:Transcript_4395/g.13280  ORF Transcript_4395/g.13280 Transcript_4395/m.13280 type:complete len:217 (+) Transcript_4395:1634-2284(+)